MSPPPSRASRPASTRTRTTTSSITKTEIRINIYDLLPPQNILSRFLWTVGASLLHTGVAIGDKEYAFGGHERPGVTGVYWTKPASAPPGGTWRCEILHGFTYYGEEEVERVVKEASRLFLGPTYNLLTRNCNHFTSHLCQALTGQPAPAWINRAAGIGVALPCIVPAGWVEPPECEAECEVADGDRPVASNTTPGAGAEQMGLMTAHRQRALESGDERGDKLEEESEGEYTDESEGEARRRESREKSIREERRRSREASLLTEETGRRNSHQTTRTADGRRESQSSLQSARSAGNRRDSQHSTKSTKSSLYSSDRTKRDSTTSSKRDSQQTLVAVAESEPRDSFISHETYRNSQHTISTISSNRRDSRETRETIQSPTTKSSRRDSRASQMSQASRSSRASRASNASGRPSGDVRDSSGREIPTSERALMDRTINC
ncbi:PPPDE putative peptidase domain-containing protein [Pyronema omphalodes]|nr:PPPDE putative peptidase domain-containing protein [Pyronema omphalodes]